jgi:hypothetical protein
MGRRKLAFTADAAPILLHAMKLELVFSVARIPA